MKRIPFILLPVAWIMWPGVLLSQHALVLDSLYSPSLGEQRYVYILKPTDETQKYPVLYLLHGAWGSYSDWIEKTDIRSYAHGLPLIIVFPDAGNSFYVNQVSDSGKRFADYMLGDVLGFIDHNYPVDTTRRAIAGLSMGGYGAFYLAARKPDAFLFTGSMSGSMSVPGLRYETVASQPDSPLAGMLLTAFGPPDSTIWAAYFPPVIATGLDKKNAPYFYFVHGIQDGFAEFLPAHRALADSLRTHDLPYEYHEVPGAHNWAFWDRHIKALMVRMMEIVEG